VNNNLLKGRAMKSRDDKIIERIANNKKAKKAKATQNALGEHLDAYWTIQEYGDFGSDWLTFIRENK
jgi:hypothetical protein